MAITTMIDRPARLSVNMHHIASIHGPIIGLDE
jgi:hypothetical protein